MKNQPCTIVQAYTCNYVASPIPYIEYVSVESVGKAIFSDSRELCCRDDSLQVSSSPECAGEADQGGRGHAG